jgi:hypothetical protein
MTEKRSYLGWLTDELIRSESWRGRVEKRRAEARRPRRVGLTLASYSDCAAMRADLEVYRGMPRDLRPYAWGPSRVERFSFDPAPNQPLDHMSRYLGGLASDGTRWIGGPAPDPLHRLYSSPTGLLPALSVDLDHHPAPTGGQASMAAARLSGAAWGTVEAQRKAFFRARPPESSFRAILRSSDLRD